jgi:hypothetical protein
MLRGFVGLPSGWERDWQTGTRRLSDPMKKLLLAAAALPCLAISAPTSAPAQNASAQAERLRDAALKDDVAYDIVEGLTTEVGPRLAGTEQEARAREWAVRKLKSLGFSNVRIETYDMPVWVRGEERAEIVSPFPQPLTLTALGNSGATPAGGMQRRWWRSTMCALEAAPDASVRGKIVFVSHNMTASQDGSQYGYFGGARRQGPSIASRKGAAAIVIRSIGTDYHRNPIRASRAGRRASHRSRRARCPFPDAEQLQRI